MYVSENVKSYSSSLDQSTQELGVDKETSSAAVHFSKRGLASAAPVAAAAAFTSMDKEDEDEDRFLEINRLRPRKLDFNYIHRATLVALGDDGGPSGIAADGLGLGGQQSQLRKMAIDAVSFYF